MPRIYNLILKTMFNKKKKLDKIDFVMKIDYIKRQLSSIVYSIFDNITTEGFYCD